MAVSLAFGVLCAVFAHARIHPVTREVSSRLLLPPFVMGDLGSAPISERLRDAERGVRFEGWPLVVCASPEVARTAEQVFSERRRIECS